MRVPCILAAAIFLGACVASVAGPETHQIAQSGETSFRTVVGKRTIVAKFRTFVAKKSDPWFPPEFEGYNELSFVQSVSVAVDGSSLPVPRSVYMDLFNARAAVVLFEKGSFVLSIAGADGADAYQVRVYFDSHKVIRRAVYVLEASTEKPSEETRYSPPTIIE